MWPVEIPAFAPFVVAALAALLTRGWVRGALMLAVIAVSGIHLLQVPEGTEVACSFLGYDLMPYRVDKLSLMFGYIFHIAAFIGVIFSLHVKGHHAAGCCDSLCRQRPGSGVLRVI